MNGDEHQLSHADARRLRDALDDCLTRRREFVRTAGEHRPDGSYVVERTGAESSGHRKVFDRFATLQALYQRLPPSFTADDVCRVGDGLSGTRGHMLVRHLTEHPAFDCDLTSRQPLTGEKRSPTPATATPTDENAVESTDKNATVSTDGNVTDEGTGNVTDEGTTVPADEGEHPVVADD